MNRITQCLGLALVLAGCTEPGLDGGPLEETEVITTVTLTFSAPGGSMLIKGSFRDPDGDGGMSGTTDPITLVAGTMYAMNVELANELVSPPEDITAEVEQEAEEHQIFVAGTAVSGPAATDTPTAIVEHVYADLESDYSTADVGDDLPVGLSNTMTTRSAGAGTLEITLRHMPPLNDEPQKVAGLAESLAAGDPLPGEVDAKVTFDFTVQ